MVWFFPLALSVIMSGEMLSIPFAWYVPFESLCLISALGSSFGSASSLGRLGSGGTESMPACLLFLQTCLHIQDSFLTPIILGFRTFLPACIHHCLGMPGIVQAMPEVDF